MTRKTLKLSTLMFNKAVQFTPHSLSRIPLKHPKSMILSLGFVFLCTMQSLAVAAARTDPADRTYLTDGWAIQSSAKVQVAGGDDLLAGIQAGRLVQGHRSVHRGRQSG